jgi:hypothetical protein
MWTGAGHTQAITSGSGGQAPEPPCLDAGKERCRAVVGEAHVGAMRVRVHPSVALKGWRRQSAASMVQKQQFCFSHLLSLEIVAPSSGLVPPGSVCPTPT